MEELWYIIIRAREARRDVFQSNSAVLVRKAAVRPISDMRAQEAYLSPRKLEAGASKNHIDSQASTARS